MWHDGQSNLILKHSDPLDRVLADLTAQVRFFPLTTIVVPWGSSV